MDFTEKKSTDDEELEEEIYEPTEEMIREVEEKEAEEARQRACKGIIRVIRPLLHLQMKESMMIKARKNILLIHGVLLHMMEPEFLDLHFNSMGLSFPRGGELMR